MRMGKLENAIKKLEIECELLCEEKVSIPTKWNCKSCKFYYNNADGSPSCIKQAIKEWALYQVE